MTFSLLVGLDLGIFAMHICFSSLERALIPYVSLFLRPSATSPVGRRVWAGESVLFGTCSLPYIHTTSVNVSICPRDIDGVQQYPNVFGRFLVRAALPVVLKFAFRGGTSSRQ